MLRIIACVLVAASVCPAQDDASSLARCGVGEVVGAGPRIGPFNPAVLASEHLPAITASVLPAPYGIRELARGGIVATTPFLGTGSSIGLQAARAGASVRVSGRMSLGLEIGKDAAVGMHVGMASWRFPRYASITECEAGAGVLLRSDVAVSGATFSLKAQQGRPVVADDMSWGVGCGLAASDELECSAEMTRAPFAPLTIRCAFTARPVDGIAVILAWADDPGTVGGGLGFEAEEWTVFAAFQWHPLLGWTQALDLRLGLE